MSQWVRLFRSRIGVAIVGAVLVGGIGAVFGAGTVWRPATLPVGGIVQGNTSNTATTSATATTQATVTPTPTETPEAAPTTVPTAAPTATRTIVGSTLRGSVVSVNVAAKTLTIRSNGVQYTILVDDTTQYTGAATQLSGIHTGWEASAAITAQENGGYLASLINTAIDN
ncbi:MAG: hypothetical protein ACM3N4_06290 [Nitrososphaerota archaeon]